MIELAGLPASGKTTFCKRLGKAMKRRGVAYHDLDTILADDYLPGSAPRFVRNRTDREILYRSLEFRRDFPELTAFAEARLDNRKRASQHFLFWLMAARYQAMRSRRLEHGEVFIDEGFVQHGSAMCLNDANLIAFEHYLDMVPLPRVLIAIRVHPEVAYARALARRGRQSISAVQNKHGQLRDFFFREKMLDLACETFTARGATVIEVPSDTHDDDAVSRVADTIAGMLQPTERASW